MGGCVTLVTLMLTLIFAALKLQQLIMHKDPTINAHTEYDALKDFEFDTAVPEFYFAIGLENLMTGEPYADPRFFRWAAQLLVVTEGGLVETGGQLVLHPCTQEDMQNFYEPLT